MDISVWLLVSLMAVELHPGGNDELKGTGTMKSFKVLIFAILFAVGPIMAQNSASAIFLLIAPGAAAGGTGEANVAATNDAYASYWNPAALAFLPKREVVYQRSAWLPNLVDDIDYNFLGVRYNIEGFGTIGGHIIYLDLGAQERRDADNNYLGDFSSYMMAAALSFGAKLSPLSSFGLNVKIIHQALSSGGTGSEKGNGISTDFGFDIGYYRRNFIGDRVDFGATISNLGPKISFIDVGQADPAPTNLKIGVKINLVRSQFNSLALIYDANKLLVANHPSIDFDGNMVIGGFDKNGLYDGIGAYSEDGDYEEAHSDPWYIGIFTSWYDDWLLGGDVDINGNNVIDTVATANDDIELGNVSRGTFGSELDTFIHNIGIEYNYSTYFAVRAGFIYDKLGKLSNPTFGVGIDYGGYGFDFNYISGAEGHPLTNTMRFSLNMAF